MTGKRDTPAPHGPATVIRPIAWLLFLALSALSCSSWAALPSLDSSPHLRVALFATLGISMLGLIFLFPETTDRSASRIILASAILLRIFLWSAPVSDDIHRYAWEGKIVASGENPYAYPASHPAWLAFRDADWHAMNHREQATAYPPGAEWILAATAIAPSSFQPFKLIALAGDLTTLLLLFHLLRKNAAPLRWAGFHAFNPIILIAFAAEAHFDSLMMAAMLAAILAASEEKPSAWLWLGAAIQVKLVCLILVPLFLTNRLLRSSWLILPLLILPTIPFITALPHWFNGLLTFAGGGAFNAPFHTLLASTGLDPGLNGFLRASAFLISAVSIILARWRGLPLVDSSLWLLGALLAFSPIVHFWYVAWLLPLAALRPSFAWTTLSITMALYFLAWDTLATHGWWGFGHGIAAIIWLPWLITALAQHRFLFKKCLLHSTPEPSPGILPGERFLSIVIPALTSGPSLQALTRKLRCELPENPEIIIATCDSLFPETPGTTIITSPRGRGNQIAAGIAATTAPWILIAHADSIPRPQFSNHLRAAVKAHPGASLLVFGQRFSTQTFPTLLVEALNEIRVVFGGVAFGDQTMVIRRSAMNTAGGFPAQPLMEDVEASLRLAATGDVIYLGREWTVSSRKWDQSFLTRFLLVIRLVATYQIARLHSPARAATVSARMYEEYYPPSGPG